MTEALLDRWVRVVSTLGTAAAPAVRAVGADLLARYAEPHRRYHTVEHLADVLEWLDRLAPEVPAGAVRPAVVAAWWHDAVHDPTRLDNERRSARLAVDALRGLGVPSPAAAEVARLVELTAAHTPDEDDPAGLLLCDADLAVLAAPVDRYAAYARAVRAEYRHVPDDAFRAGRAAVLRGLLDRPALYGTRYARRHLEEAARRNVAAELDRLDAGAPAGLSDPGGAAGAGPPP